MYSLMNVELPEPSGRLRLPIVMTDSKARSEEENRNSLEEFVADCCYEAPGVLTPFKDFFDKFYESLTVNEKGDWSKQRVIKGIPSASPRGRTATTKSASLISLWKKSPSPPAPNPLSSRATSSL